MSHHKEHDADIEIKRKHSASHIMTAAVQMIHGKEIGLGVGPWTDDGFYQDFDFGDKAVTDKDFKDIEKKMRWIVNKDMPIKKAVVKAEEARKLCEGDPYKTELIEEIIARGEDISFYYIGESLDKAISVNLCAGPHLNSTGELGAFKLMKLAGAYWRGDEKNKMLTRIYGVAFESEEKLEEHLKRLEEMAARDHRKIGKDQGLWTFSELVGIGLPLFTPKGTVIRNELFSCLLEISKRYDMLPVTIPHLAKRRLYEISGHADKFGDELITVHSHYDEFVLKPVNCPHHTQIYASEMRSYRDLPLRLMESTMQYRDEQPGEIGGLTRVRSITCDDGHIFCRIDQVEEEATNIAHIIKEFYGNIGLWGNHWVSLSVRDPQRLDKYIGDEEGWQKAEAMLQSVSDHMSLGAKRMEGEAALYGPKLDFMFTDALGRERQLATIQIDFAMPKRFGLEYVDKDGQKKTPVMIHRAILGSYERFMALLIEHFAGAFPTWLSPVQAVILPIGEKHAAFAEEVKKQLKKANIRVELSEATETLGKRVRTAKMQKVPYMLVIGDAEVDAASATLEHRDLGKVGTFTITDILARLTKEITERALKPTV